MLLLVDAAGALISVFRSLLLVAAVVLGLVCLVDWAVRTRRISPFNAVARFFRDSVDPLFSPMERRVVRAGGSPASAPFWAFLAVMVIGILLLTLLDFLREQLIAAAMWTSQGSAGVLHLVLSATFSFLRVALIVRVVASWLPISPYSRWVRWSYVVSEPLLAPFRRFMPSLGGLDITPLIAYFLLGFIESGLFRLLGI